jgi:hypothetical protein
MDVVFADELLSDLVEQQAARVLAARVVGARGDAEMRWPIELDPQHASVVIVVEMETAPRRVP